MGLSRTGSPKLTMFAAIPKRLLVVYALTVSVKADVNTVYC